MAKRRKRAAIRNPGHPWARWLILAAVGAIAGAFLGETAIGNRPGATIGAGASYSEYSANPDALTPVALQNPCLDCPDSYGVAARLRADDDGRMTNAFRELGTVDIDRQPVEEPSDNYRYGGRFPYPGPDATIPAANVVPDTNTDTDTTAALPEEPQQ